MMCSSSLHAANEGRITMLIEILPRGKRERDVKEVTRIINQLRVEVKESYNLWLAMPANVRNELERLFNEVHGAGYHLNQAVNCLKGIISEDIRRIVEA